ncbi:MAG: phosphatidylglycerol lysyltransferase domain-containing protein [Sphaerochaetaceae bacterium]
MHSIPNYPEEIPLSLYHLEELQPYLLRNRAGISELSMASLFPFTHKRHYKVSAYENNNGERNYIIKGIQWQNDVEELFAILPSGYPGKEILNSLLEEVSEVNTISETLLQEWQEALRHYHPSLSLQEDRDNADYIYDKQSLIDLVGQQLHKKMAHVKKFAQTNPKRILIPAHLVNKEDLIHVLDKWANGRELVEDYKATLEAINHQAELNLKGVVLYSDDVPVAFTLGEHDSDKRFIIHVEKADITYKGIYQYINRAFVKDLDSSIVEINREQDLGIPGLRQAKLTYQPSRLLMKWRIRK